MEGWKESKGSSSYQRLVSGCYDANKKGCGEQDLDDVATRRVVSAVGVHDLVHCHALSYVTLRVL